MKTQHEIDAEHLIGALKLGRERVTADSIAGKQEQRDQFRTVIGAMYLYLDTGKDKPSADDLRRLLGDPEDKPTREALRHWD